MDQLIRKIQQWISRKDGRILIGISGHGAAGKTTFANELADRLGRDEVNDVNSDPYIVSSDVRKGAIIQYTYQNEEHRYKMTACHPASHHLPSLERDIQMIRDGLNLYTLDMPYMKK